MKQDYRLPIANRQDLINHLIKKNKFKQIAPHTLLYKNKVDVITVYLGKSSDGFTKFIILADGSNIITSYSVTFICDFKSEDWEDALQEILSRF